MKPLIKWPGGKSEEINKIEKYIPSYSRYVEPFFGGGAMFFHLQPEYAAINDISKTLMEYYCLIKKQDAELYELLMCYSNSFSNLIKICNENYDSIFNIYTNYISSDLDIGEAQKQLAKLVQYISDEMCSEFADELVLDSSAFIENINSYVLDKMQRTYKNELIKPFSAEDMKQNLITGFTSGYYMYFRDVYNSIQLNKTISPSVQYKVANFYFIREFCYGSMFRYNSKGEFNIPYGGMSYNRKNLKAKIDNMFCDEVETLFAKTEIVCSDFESFLNGISLSSKDFMFLDPPYDTNFSDYEGKDFTKFDQERLAYFLRKTEAQFILIIKNTEFIRQLYEEAHFQILSFDKQYTYNIKSRNERDVEHLIITNLPIQ